ncbi:oxygenase MpaB family protein [Mycolicibacterium aubagnense]
MDAVSTFRRVAGLPVADALLTPAVDYGFFGPDSVTWRVWSYPTSLLLGFARAVTIEHLDPFLAAAVDASGQVYARTRLRYDRTMQYFALVAFGDAESVLDASEIWSRFTARPSAPSRSPASSSTRTIRIRSRGST